MDDPFSSKPPRSPDGGSGPGFSWLILLLPLACCGGPFIIVGLATLGAIAWGGIGALVVAIVVAIILVGRRRRSRLCCNPKVGSNVVEDTQLLHDDMENK